MISRSPTIALRAAAPFSEIAPEPRAADDPQFQKRRLFEAIFSLIRPHDARVCHVVVLEDAHWADPTSQELIHYLARAIERERLLLIVSYRTDELHRRHPLTHLLAQLNREYILTLCTKGDRDEQQIKIDRSGLVGYFHQVEIMSEKDADGYQEILGRLGARPAEACMIGNSPKSDINPPLQLGMAAVFIPHDHTWQLEHQEVDRSHPRLLVVDRFVDLIRHF